MARLFVAHRGRLEALVSRRINDRDAAGEIVQDVFSRVFRAGTRGSEDADTRLLYVAARNAAIEHNRSHARRRRIFDDLRPEQLSWQADLAPDSIAQGREAVSALDRALAELSPRAREIFLLHRVQGLPNAEIARRQGISVSAVEKHIARALRHCQARLSSHLDTH